MKSCERIVELHLLVRRAAAQHPFDHTAGEHQIRNVHPRRPRTAGQRQCL